MTAVTTMTAVKAYAAQTAESPLAPFSIQRRQVGDNDVQLEILYCGVCHSDIHQARNEWGGSIFPMVPGHEILGRVRAVGKNVKKFAVGALGAVGCFVDSCRICESCKAGLEQYCEKGMSGTYNGYEQDGKTPTYGGYSKSIVVDENYMLSVSPDLAITGVAPLLCAGITTWSPLRHVGVGKGHKVAVMGLGGLGHMGVKFAASFGAEVTVFSTSPNKAADAKALGAHNFVVTTDEKQMKPLRNHFDFILNTVSAPLNMSMYLNTLRRDGTMMLVGVPPEPMSIHAFDLIPARKKVLGSMIGGIAETQEMLDYCAAHKIVSDVEVIDIGYINKAYERMIKSDVKYRFVIDMASLA